MKIIKGVVTQAERLGKDDFILEVKAFNCNGVTMLSKSSFKAKPGDKVTIKIEGSNDKN